MQFLSWTLQAKKSIILYKKLESSYQIMLLL